MSTNVHRFKPRMSLSLLARLLVLAILTLGIAGGIVSGARIGQADVSCGPTGPGAVTITSTSEGEIRLARTPSSPVITVNGVACGTVNTVDTIVVSGSVQAENLVVDMTNGSFAPGLTAESSPNASEIEITGNLGAGADYITILGQNSATAADSIYAGGGSSPVFNLNGDTDADDLTMTGFEAVTADLQAGNDLFTGQGGAGTGSPVTMALGVGPGFPIPPVRGGTGNDSVIGGNGDDVLSGGAGNDAVDGGNGNDTVAGDDGDDSINGNEGDDLLAPGAGNDGADGGNGFDTASYADAPGPDGITANPAEHTVTGHSVDSVTAFEAYIGTNFNDTFYEDPTLCEDFSGGSGDDVFIAVTRPGDGQGGTCDNFDGGPGRDAYDATNVPAEGELGVTFDFANNIVHGSGTDICTDCEYGKGTDAGNDVFYDDPNACNDFEGNGGDDKFVAVNRPGTEEGGTCGDIFDGGEGGETAGDTYDATAIPAHSPGVVFDFVKAVVHGSGEDTCTNCENGTGTTGDDQFIDEDNSCNTFDGGTGDDLFLAGVQRPGSENDPEHGVCGDTVDLGEGGETSGDTLDYGRTESHSPGVKIDIPNGIVHGSPEDIGQNAENAFGSEFDDEIIGSAENNTILGRGGDDVIVSGGGNDTIDGGPGNDTIDGVPEGPPPPPPGPAGMYCNLEQGVLIKDGVKTTGVKACPVGGPGDDVLIGNGKNNILRGGGGNDRLIGNGGNDKLTGDDGNDELRGGDGRDLLTGGAGNDALFGDSGKDKLDGGPGTDVLRGGEQTDLCRNGEDVGGCEAT